MAVYVTIYGHVCVIHTPKLCYICIHMYVCICIRMYVCMYVHTRTLVVCVCLSLSLSLALYQQNQVDVVRICGPIYGISGVYSPYLWPYIVRICGHVLPIFFVLVSIFGYILGIYGQGGAPVFIFFIDARDGTAGGLVGWRMSRASMKKIEPASGLGPMPSAWNTPGARPPLQ